MNIIYRLVNRTKEKANEYPCYYIGSKLNYIPGRYWGSSRHPILIEELNTSIENFEIEILAYVDNPTLLTENEYAYQLKYNVIDDIRYYNLQYANKKFTSYGFKWYYDPTTLKKGYFPSNKIPKGWCIGKCPEYLLKNKRKATPKGVSGLQKNDPALQEYISDANSLYEWVLEDPNGNLHTVTKLHKFISKHRLTPKLRYVDRVGGPPIKKGKSKGWRVVSKSEKTQ